jgi:hypothetical protein
LLNWLVSKIITPPQFEDNHPNAYHIEDLVGFDGLQLHNGSSHTADTRENTGLPILSSQMLCPPDADPSEDSEAETTNQFLLMLRVRDLNPCMDWVVELLALFDTGCPHNFIFPLGLAKLGSIKWHPLPPGRDGKLKGYTSPINPDHTIVPKYFVRVILWNTRIGLIDRVDLKIVQLPEGTSTRTDGADIILGRRLFNKHGDPSLLEKVVEANAEDPRLAAINDNSISVLLKSKTSRSTYQYIHCQKANFANAVDAEQKLINKREDDRRRNQDRITSIELHKKFKEPSPGSSMGAQSTGTAMWSETSERSQDASAGLQRSAGSHASVQQPNTLPPGPNFGDPAAQQIAQDHSASCPDYGGERRSPRSDTWSTQSTQNTQFSLARKSTTSSLESWVSISTNGGKLAGYTADYAAPQADPIS